MKFNYTKKNEKAKNLKALKYQIQQVDMYAEKIQVMKKKVCVFACTTTVTAKSFCISILDA